MSLTQSTSNALLNLYFRRETYATSNLFLGLLDASGTELSGSGYNRVDVSSAFGTPSDGAVSNSAQITFPAATATWKSTFVSIFNASVGGQALATIKWQIMTFSGQQLTFAPESIKIHLSDVPNRQYYNGFNERHINWRFVGPDVWSNYEHLRGKKLPVVDRVFSTAAVTPNAFAGGVLLRDGRVFCVPRDSSTVAKIYDINRNIFLTPSATTPISSGFAGGVLLPDGRVFCVPHSSTTARIYDPVSDVTYTPPSATNSYPGGGGFYGGVLLPDGRVFCVPNTSTTARIYDPVNDITTTPQGSYPALSNSFFGGTLLSDGRVFCVPFNSERGYIYNPASNTTISTSIIGSGTGKFYGGVLLPDGRVFCVPHSSTTARIYDPVSDVTYTPPSATNSYPGGGGFIGGVLLPDGRVFCTPWTSATARIYDPILDTTIAVSGTGSNFHGGVLLPDGRVFCVPHNKSTAVIYGTARGYTLPDARVLSAYDNKF